MQIIESAGESKENEASQQAPLSVRRWLLGCGIMGVLVVLACVGGLFVWSQAGFCRHCFARGSSPDVAHAIVEFRRVTGALPGTYADLERASQNGRIGADVPVALWWGEWEVVSADEVGRSAVVYRADRAKRGVTAEELRKLLRNPASTATMVMTRGREYFTGYDFTAGTSSPAVLFTYDSVLWYGPVPAK